MTPADLIIEARERHPSFSPARHDDSLCLRRIGSGQREFYREVAKIAEAELATDAVFDAAAITTALAGTPLTLPASKKILSILVALPHGIFPVWPYQDERAARKSGYYARLIGRELYLTQPTAFLAEMPADEQAMVLDNTGLAEALALRVTYVPLPVDPVALSTTMTAPIDARDYLVEDLVEFMARRSSLGGIHAEAKAAKAAVLEEIGSRVANETDWYVENLS